MEPSRNDGAKRRPHVSGLLMERRVALHSRELSEIRACARDLPSQADPGETSWPQIRQISRILSARDFSPMSKRLRRRLAPALGVTYMAATGFRGRRARRSQLRKR